MLLRWQAQQMHGMDVIRWMEMIGVSGSLYPNQMYDEL